MLIFAFFQYFSCNFYIININECIKKNAEANYKNKNDPEMQKIIKIKQNIAYKVAFSV